MDNKENKIEKLKDYFEKREDIVMAFLFGSRTKGEGFARENSDWDIAVYFRSKSEQAEWNRDADYPKRNEVLNDLFEILRIDAIDLIILNHAYPLIANVALNGIVLTIKNRRLWFEFMLLLSNEAMDFIKTSREYAETYWRSASLVQEDAMALEDRLIFLDSEFKNFMEKYHNITWEEYQKDDMKRKVLERVCEILINAAIDVSRIVLAASKKSRPHSYDEILLGAAFTLSFDGENAKIFSQFAPLRNILAHQYLDYRWKEITPFLEFAPSIFSTFIDSARKFLEENRTEK